MLLAVVVVCGCGAASEEEQAPVAETPVCHWERTDGCEPCAGRRDYGADNTCEGVIWQGRSETDFCLQTFPCDYSPQPVTRIEGN